MDKELELLNAMAAGVNEYLRSTRGANIFGANATAVVVDNENLVVTTAIGEFIFFSGVDYATSSLL